MATAMNTIDHHHQHSTFGFLLIIADLINNEQRDEMLRFLRKALKKIHSHNPLQNINEHFNQLINENEFQAGLFHRIDLNRMVTTGFYSSDAQYRQIENTEDGSVIGFLYLPSFQTVFNVLHDYFDHCLNVCIIFCGQQMDSTGALLLSDGLFTVDHFTSLFQTDGSTQVENLQLILPFVSSQWKKMFQDHRSGSLRDAQVVDASTDIDEDNHFGEGFYHKLSELLQDDTINFDVHTKLIPKDTAGTIAFDEPNLYVLYGQQGEASLFGVRGFVVLVNGGFSRLPSYWNLIRGLQTIDACILTHFDYDVLPGLQSVIHRKTIPSPFDGRLCKPDIGVLLVNPIQRAKLQSSSKSSTNPLIVNLHENISEFYRDAQQLNIPTLDLVKSNMDNKGVVEPINLYKKIAFGSLDLYVLHPLAATLENEKVVASLQKIPIRDQIPSSEIIPHHHWYSSCSLLVWSPAVTSDQNRLVRILYTGVCPQTLVFDALHRVRQLEFLRASSSKRESQTIRTNPIGAATVTQAHVNAKRSSSSQQKMNGKGRNSSPTKTSKASTLPAVKPAAGVAKPIKFDQSSLKSTTKKITPTAPSKPAHSASKEKKIVKNVPPAKKPSRQVLQTKPTKETKRSSSSSSLSRTTGKGREHQEPQLNVTWTQAKDPDHQTEAAPEEHLESTAEGMEDVHDEHAEITNQESESEQVIHDQDDLTKDERTEIHDEAFSNAHDDDEITREEQGETDDENPVDIPNEDETNETEPILSSAEDATEIPDGDRSDLQVEDAEVPSVPASIDPVSEDLEVVHDQTTDGENEDPDMEIIHHDIKDDEKALDVSTEEIHPQGLPIENKQKLKNSTGKKLANASTRASRPSTLATDGNLRSSSQSKQTSSSTDFIFHVDVAYIPNHGHENYVDQEFFRRIRAQYYILNAVQINRRTLESLIEGKEQWDDNGPTTLVPTSDNESLRQFFLMNKTRLAELNINILPASSRCHVQYDDDSSPAQLLRFNTILNNNEL